MLSNVEKQRAYRERMREKGYTWKQVWVLYGKKKMKKETFLQKLEELTAGFTDAGFTKLYSEIIALVKTKKEEYEK
jgi:G:T-mismatch repair DNA endonuclease (very short patch repair protein)